MAADQRAGARDGTIAGQPGRSQAGYDGDPGHAGCAETAIQAVAAVRRGLGIAATVSVTTVVAARTVHFLTWAMMQHFRVVGRLTRRFHSAETRANRLGCDHENQDDGQ